MTESRAPIAPEAVMALAQISNLAMTADRARELAAHMETVIESAERLRALDVTRFEPALIFRPLP